MQYQSPFIKTFKKAWYWREERLIDIESNIGASIINRELLNDMKIIRDKMNRDVLCKTTKGKIIEYNFYKYLQEMDDALEKWYKLEADSTKEKDVITETPANNEKETIDDTLEHKPIKRIKIINHSK